MLEVALTNKIQPCLLDKLIDLNPDKKVESASERVFGDRHYRRVVLCDLNILLSTPRPRFEGGLEEFDEVDSSGNRINHIESSVLNFGVPPLCGAVSSSLDPDEVARAFRDALEHFEPRLAQGTITVEAIVDRWKDAGNELIFEINADLCANPAPEELRLRTSLDLETGAAILSEMKPL